jgi:hypothetical protein
MRKPQKPEPTAWAIYKIANKLKWLGTVVAASEHEAIENGAEEFKTPASRLVATRERRRSGHGAYCNGQVRAVVSRPFCLTVWQCRTAATLFGTAEFDFERLGCSEG